MKHNQSGGISHSSVCGCWRVKCSTGTHSAVHTVQTKCDAFRPFLGDFFLKTWPFLYAHLSKLDWFSTAIMAFSRTQRDSDTHTHTHGWTRAPLCEANSFCHKWSQIGSGQSPITAHLGWPYTPPSNTYTNPHLHTHTCTQINTHRQRQSHEDTGQVTKR